MAHAAMVSLRRTIGDHDEIDSICSTLERLDDECYRGIDRSEIHELDAQIRDAALKLEDVVESHQLSQGADDTAGVKQEIDSFFETAKKLAEEYDRALQNSSCVAEEEEEEEKVVNSSTVGIGVSDLSEEIISGLLDGESQSQIFSISGMAGIGKTHLARSVYQHPLIVQHFDLRLWVRMGPIHKDVKHVLLDILSKMEGKPRDLFKEKDEDELIDLVCSLVDDQIFIIVFDDIWSKSVLIDCLNALSLHKNDECKALITTRTLFLAETWSGNQECQMPFLSDEESWDLLRQNVFAEKTFPSQLEKLGRKIAEICEGLPLLILTVADILRGLDQTEEFWNKVAAKKTTTFRDAYDRIYKVLIPSYDYLPQKYKANFLYLGVFRVSYQIPVSKLIHLWLVEGLFVDHGVFDVLPSNSVVIDCNQEFNIINYWKLHSVYWYVCVTEARKTRLFHVLIKLSDVFIESQPRRLSVQNNMLLGLNDVRDSMAAATSSTRSLLFTGEYHQYPIQICFHTMALIKVLDALEIRFYEFPNEVTTLLLLKYLALTHNGEVPSSISNLQRLRFLILRRHHNIINMLQRDSTTCLPKEIWDFEKLLYLRIMGNKLPNPGDDKELPNLIKLYVNDDSCTESVFRGTPKLVKLGIEIELQPEAGSYYQVPFLSDEESWDLLRQNVFAEKPNFLCQLEKPGRKIAELCEGLPLLILTVADILRGLDETEDCWNKVAQKKTTTFPDAYDRIFKVLIPSYEYLPQKYKGNFLYLGIFRQSQDITISKLIHLWLVEGLLVDHGVLDELQFNSVVIVNKQEFHIINYWKLHSVYWYVCVTEARKTEFFHVLIKLSDVSIERQPRRLSVQNNIFGLKQVCDSIAEATSLTRSLLFTGEYHQYPVQVSFNTMLLMKVLYALEIRFYEFPNEVTNLLLLKYLALTHNGEVPSSISNLQRLYFLILRRHHNIINMLQGDSRTCLPQEIWDIENLLYLRIMGSKLPYPGHNKELPKLFKLYVNDDSSTESVFKGTPKLVKLGIEIELQPEGGAESLRCLEHTGILIGLKRLKCVVVNPRLMSSQAVEPPNHLSNLPRYLMKLSLNGLGYPWNYISAIASLTNLETLKLQCSAFRGAVWEIKDGEFSRLKYLLLEDIDVVQWIVNGSGVKNLSQLVFRHCYKLKTIPFNYILQLKMIEVNECSPAIVELTQQMKDNPNFQDVIINYSWNL